MLDKIKGKIKARLLKNYIPKKFYSCTITKPYFYPSLKTLKTTFLVVCSNGFIQGAQTASALMREGFARGWADSGGVAKLVSVKELLKEVKENQNPLIFFSEFDFEYLSFADLRELRDVKKMVWVGAHPKMYNELFSKLKFLDSAEFEISISNFGKIIYSEPVLVWNAIGKKAMHYYQGWIDDGFHWKTIYPAVDTSKYFPVPRNIEMSKIKMAYIGRYWAEKAQGLDLYLRPWEDIVNVYGESVWPYKNYGGAINLEDERTLYSSAGLIPLITGPYGWEIAEITERYLKAPACRAFCISDHNSAVSEIFTKEEMMVSEDSEHFNHLVNEYLNDQIDINKYKENAYQAVLSRHTYKNRIEEILAAIKI